MERKELLFWTDKDMRIEAARLLDLVEAVKKRGGIQLTPFLSTAMANWLEGILRREKLTFIHRSGFPLGERARYQIGDSQEELEIGQNGVCVLRLLPVDPKAELNHRHILGSLMGLGLKREVIGDIQPGQAGYYVAVNEEIAPFILDEWDQVGREKITVTRIEHEPEVIPEEAEERYLTVNSPRLDAVIAAGFGLSRTEAQSLITQGKIKRNDLVIFKADSTVEEGDLLSCRGYGRLRLEQFLGSTRKGRNAFKAALYRSRKQ